MIVDIIEDQGLRVRQAQFAARFNLSLTEYLQIVRTLPMADVVTVLELMKTAKHRTSARQYAHDQVRRWLDMHIPCMPLSRLELKRLAPTWPIRWVLPT
jgi:hypothetical protein